MTESALRVYRSGAEVHFALKLSTVGGDFIFALRVPEEWAAMLLVQAISKQLFDAMSAIRKNAYEQGWRDAKAKRAKEQWFSRRLP